jgi:hypothetical protein
MDKAVMIGGKLTEVHETAQDKFIIKGSKWFTANYNEFVEVMKIVKRDYEDFKSRAETLRIENSEKFTLDKMTEKFKTILMSFGNKPEEQKLILPKLTKVK